jgi:hypothetical protein
VGPSRDLDKDARGGVLSTVNASSRDQFEASQVFRRELQKWAGRRKQEGRLSPSNGYGSPKVLTSARPAQLPAPCGLSLQDAFVRTPAGCKFRGRLTCQKKAPSKFRENRDADEAFFRRKLEFLASRI